MYYPALGIRVRPSLEQSLERCRLVLDDRLVKRGVPFLDD